MLYATLTDLQQHMRHDDLVNLTDLSGYNTIDEAVATAACSAASERIDGYLRGRYLVPLNPVPGLIRDLAVRLAIHQLYNNNQALILTDQLQKSHEEDLTLLTKLRKGDVVIEAESSGAMMSSSLFLTNRQRDEKDFAADVLARFA